jgi:homogentisate 1,2-dioxygenase
MLDRIIEGRVPPKHHTALRDGAGKLYYEECFTRDGFDGPYTILYREGRPQAQEGLDGPAPHGWAAPTPGTTDARPLRKRLYQAPRLPRRGGPPVDARVPLLYNADVVVGVVHPDAPDPVYVVNADGDDLVYVFEGGGTLRSPMGDLRFEAGDYVAVPRALPHRFVPDEGVRQTWLAVECLGALHLPRQWRNEVGQLRMDAPYSHRDFRRPTFRGPVDEGLRTIVVKRNFAWSAFRAASSPLDVVGWDGTVYPFAFPIRNFQPRVGLVHLPPTWHGTFATRGALVCSFVPRPVDFHPQAIPCPYPHSSPSCDEIIFYCDGNFTSRRGVGPGAISHHPAGIPHGPHPGAYEASIGSKETSELAVMLDTYLPLTPTAAALSVEEPGYHQSFL